MAATEMTFSYEMKSWCETRLLGVDEGMTGLQVEVMKKAESIWHKQRV